MASQSTSNRRSKIINEVLNAVSHGIGALLSIAALVFLILKGINSGSGVHLTAYLIYGISMFLLFLSSTLYHSFSFTRFQKVFRYIDHAAIYLLIAGTYTPFCLIALEGQPLSYAFFGVVWGIALFGVVFKIFFLNLLQNGDQALFLVAQLLQITVNVLVEFLDVHDVCLLGIVNNPITG